ncbi:Unknown protein sequence [Pseudomonas syringae pv. coryli]|uniref:Uncharacterized protein n=1 Tax=Pseudomonas syringae pv. coryli TaxID=317659 RepID=A0A0P9N4L0_9PSED|nr:Unknown protein sequence [Pseudomonas syringae pv. coryli]
MGHQSPHKRALSSLLLGDRVTNPQQPSRRQQAQPLGLISEFWRSSPRAGALCFTPIAQAPFPTIPSYFPASTVDRRRRCMFVWTAGLVFSGKTDWLSTRICFAECLHSERRGILVESLGMVIEVFKQDSSCLPHGKTIYRDADRHRVWANDMGGLQSIGNAIDQSSTYTGAERLLRV